MNFISVYINGLRRSGSLITFTCCYVNTFNTFMILEVGVFEIRRKGNT